MVAIPNEQDLLARTRRFLRFIRPDIDASDDSITSRFHLYPAAIAGKIAFKALADVQGLQLLDRLTGTDLDAEGTNYGLVRASGKRAKGPSAVFYTYTAPTADIVIPAGQIITTSNVSLGKAISFRTLSSRKLPGGAAANSYYKPDTRRWETPPIPIEAVDPGAQGIVGPNRITLVQGSLPGIDGVTNPLATSGGTDQESDEQFRARISRRRLGPERNIRRGLEAYVGDTFGFEDSHAVRSDDEGVERPDGTDVWVIDDSVSEVTGALTHYAAVDIYVLPHRPVLAISALTSASAGALIEGTDYDLERDVRTFNRFSSRSSDRIRILPAGHLKLADGESATVVYSYANMVEDAQTAIDEDDARILTADPLVKRAIRFDVSIRAVVTFFAGSDPDQERARVQLALSQLLSSGGLKAPIQASDLVVAMESGVAGVEITSVDQVILRSVVATSELGEVRAIADDPDSEQIVLAGNEYARFGDIVFVPS